MMILGGIMEGALSDLGLALGEGTIHCRCFGNRPRAHIFSSMIYDFMVSYLAPSMHNLNA